MKKALYQSLKFILSLLLIVALHLNAQLTSPPSAITSNVPEASQYKVVYEYNIPANMGAVSYVQNNSAATGVSFTKVAYFLQLDTKWVWVSMNKFTSTLSQLGIPYSGSGIIFQQTVSGMNVLGSSNSGVTNASNINGNIEIWPNCYNTGLGLAGIGGNASNYDFNDLIQSGTVCYGSFQVHNYGASQTIFAYNSFNEPSQNDDLGIGNNTGTHPDWTFMYNAAGYTTKKLYILVNSCSEITISAHPNTSTQNLCQNSTTASLSVSATTSAGTINGYQWYKNSTSSYTGATSISGATSSSYTLPTSASGTNYYFCVVSNTNGCAQYSNISGAVNVNLKPSFTTHPATTTQTLCQNSTPTSLSIVATAGSGSISSYQWYKNASSSNVSGNALSGATSTSYAPNTSIEGGFYYYCQVTNTNNCTSASNVSGLIKVDSFIWMGTQNNIPTNSSNWASCGVPSNGKNLYFHPNATNDLVLDGPKNFGVVDFRNSNKKLILNNYDLRTTGFYNFSATNYIKTNGTGKVIMSIAPNQTITMPVGNSSYNPITITNRTGSADSFTVNLMDTVYLNGAVSGSLTNARVNRTWNIGKKNANAGSGIDLSFTWNASDLKGVLATPTMNHHTGSKWEIPTMGTSSVSGTTLTYTGYTGTFSPFAIGGSTTVALPVELISFQATCQNDQVRLDWTTASEKNNDRFELYKSENVMDWQLIGTQKGSGTTSERHSYSLYDNLSSPISYYKLKNIDFDGTENSSNIIVSKCEVVLPNAFISPNPAEDFVVVSLPWEDVTNYTILNLNGNVQKQGVLISNKTRIALSDLMPGVYLLEINKNNHIEKFKLIKVK